MATTRRRPIANLQLRPVSAERISDLQRFSAEHGKFGYCSCMRWRMTSSEFRRSSKETRAGKMSARALAGEATGVLAYDNGQPVGWCSIAPRQAYAALERSRTLPPIDNKPVWSVVCFFVDSRYRRQGITLALLKAAVEYAASEGALIVEGYPVEPDATSYTYMGSPNTFLRAGFEDVTPTGQKRAIMRRHISASERMK